MKLNTDNEKFHDKNINEMPIKCIPSKISNSTNLIGYDNIKNKPIAFIYQMAKRQYNLFIMSRKGSKVHS